MARLLFTGFEIPNYRHPFVYTETAGGAIVFDSSVKRSGGYSLRFDTAIGVNGSRIYADIPNSPTEVFARFGLRINGTPNSDVDFFRVHSDVTSALFRMRMQSGTGKIQVLVAGTVRITSETILSANTWYLVELRMKMADAGNVTLRINGLEDGAWNGDTQPGADTRLTTARIGVWWNGAMNTWYFDDVALNDASGDAHNSWCGDGRIVAARPDAAGDLTQWTPDSGANYARVNETTPDGDASYVYAESAGLVDLYHVATPSIPANGVVRGVWIDHISRKVDASADDRVRGLLKVGETTVETDDAALSTVYQLFESAFITENPDTLAPWQIEDLAGIQVGVKAT